MCARNVRGIFACTSQSAYCEMYRCGSLPMPFSKALRDMAHCGNGSVGGDNGRARGGNGSVGGDNVE